VDRQPEQPDRHLSCRLCQRCGISSFRCRREVVVVLDEAYNEYLPPAERVDTTAWLADLPNLVITRTFSKIHGLAGLRIGYALTSAEIADLMNRVRQPFNCNNLALAAAVAALDDHRFVAESYALNRAGMEQIVAGLKRLGLHAHPVARQLRHLPPRRRWTNQKLLRQGVIVRPIAAYGLPDWLRVTIGSESENARFLAALEARCEARSRGTAMSGAVLFEQGRGLRRRADRRFVRAGAQGSRAGRRGGRFRAHARLAEPGAATRDSRSRRFQHRAGGVYADLVLIAAPVGMTGEIMARIAPCLGPQTVVSDAGSTKEDVVAAARAHFGERIGQFVPAHPIAGAENSGARRRAPTSTADRQVVLTPLAGERCHAASRCVRSAWEACGAIIRELGAAEHDRIFAAVSHLPHLLSFALVHELAGATTARLLFDLPPAVFATSRGLPPAIPRCGATSVSPTGWRCSRNSTATGSSSTTCAMRCTRPTGRGWKRLRHRPAARRDWGERRGGR
jgi:prephenate dehydrogenase